MPPPLLPFVLSEGIGLYIRPLKPDVQPNAEVEGQPPYTILAPHSVIPANAGIRRLQGHTALC